MNHVKTYNIGDHTDSPRAKAKKTAPAGKRVNAVDAKTQRCRRDQKGQNTVRSDSDASNGFLKIAFLPKLKETQGLQALKKTAKTERDFYKSLSQMSKHYGFELMPVQSYEYPYNIALSLWDAQKKLQKKMRDFEEIRLIQDGKKTHLTCKQRYNTGAILYYIPIIPLFRMLKNHKHRHSAQLLLSVCSYLFHVADVPYYRQENSFLYWQYEMQKEWITQDEDSEETACLSELDKAEWVGSYMEQKIFNLANLKFFNHRLTHFEGKDPIDLACIKVAEKAFNLYERYSYQSIFTNARPNGDAEEDDRDNIATMDMYVSFCADNRGWLSDNLEESVNNYLQEYGQMEEPTIINHFDGNPISENNLDFENRLFALMEELAEILNYY